MAQTNKKIGVHYRMRNSNILIRMVRVEKMRGIFMPEASVGGHQFVVEEVGPDVKDLTPGDIVFVKGTPGKDIGTLPNDSSLMVAPQENVLLVMVPEQE